MIPPIHQRGKPVYFVSDTHLDPSRLDGIHGIHGIQLFADFLNQKALLASDLYMLGDMFAYWIGDDDVWPTLDPVIKAFHRLHEHGVRLHFMRGNRDFLVSQAYLTRFHCHDLPDPTLIRLGEPDGQEHRLLLTHGDGFCLNDKAYARYRRCVRNPVFQACFLALPIQIRQWMAARLRRASSNRNDGLLFEVNPRDIEQLMDTQQVDVLIHGHTHNPCLRYFHSQKTGHCQTYAVLGDWGQSGSVLTYQNHEFSLSAWP